MLNSPFVEITYLTVWGISLKVYFSCDGLGFDSKGFMNEPIIFDTVGKYRMSEYMSKIDFSNSSLRMPGLKFYGPFSRIYSNFNFINPTVDMTTIVIIINDEIEKVINIR